MKYLENSKGRILLCCLFRNTKSKVSKENNKEFSFKFNIITGENRENAVSIFVFLIFNWLLFRQNPNAPN